MDLEGKFLDDWFMNIESYESFPYSFDYPTQFKHISNILNKWVHPYVNAGAKLKDKNGYLTDHGPEHIKTIIKRIGQFIDGNPNCDLNPYEVYLLLMAAHIHDVGNIMGRQGHEVNARFILNQVRTSYQEALDQFEWDMIYDIARSHKGTIIEKVLTDEDYMDEKHFRPQLLAAILKFADELAENKQRADRFNLAFEAIPEESILFHQYAHSLNSVLPQPKSRSISMIYDLNESILTNKFKKYNDETGNYDETFLVDEIYLRNLKTHYERLYCMRFMRPFINLDTIKVTFRIRLENDKRVDQKYEILEGGIEHLTMDEIFKFCPELKMWKGTDYHGHVVNNTLEEYGSN